MLSGNCQAVQYLYRNGYRLGRHPLLQMWTRLTITRQHMTAKPKLLSLFSNCVTAAILFVLHWEMVGVNRLPLVLRNKRMISREAQRKTWYLSRMQPFSSFSMDLQTLPVYSQMSLHGEKTQMVVCAISRSISVTRSREMSHMSAMFNFEFSI